MGLEKVARLLVLAVAPIAMIDHFADLVHGGQPATGFLLERGPTALRRLVILLGRLGSLLILLGRLSGALLGPGPRQYPAIVSGTLSGPN